MRKKTEVEADIIKVALAFAADKDRDHQRYIRDDSARKQLMQLQIELDDIAKAEDCLACGGNGYQLNPIIGINGKKITSGVPCSRCPAGREVCRHLRFD